MESHSSHIYSYIPLKIVLLKQITIIFVFKLHFNTSIESALSDECFLHAYNILIDEQHGFRPDRSTIIL